MSVKKILNAMKSIFPILATLLLIVIAVAAIVVTYTWITPYMSSAISQAGIILYRENMIDITIDVHEIVSAGIALSGGSIVELTINGSNDLANNWESGESYYLRIAPNKDNSTNSMNKLRNNHIFNIPPLMSSAWNKILLVQTMNPLSHTRIP